MSFVFGWYSFKVKSYNPEDLNIEKNDRWDNATFEVRQKIFHLFWLPFFGIGKIYGLRKNGQLLDLPESIISIIKSRGKPPTPWYAFFIPVMAIVVAIGFAIHYGIWEYNRYYDYKNQYETAINKIDQEIPELTTNHYIKIRDFSHLSDSKGIFLKLKSKIDQQLTFYILKTNLKDREALPIAINRFYQTFKEELDSVTLTENDLKKAICYDHSIYKKNKPYGIDLLKNGKKFSIENIKYIEGPNITVRSFDSKDIWDLMRRNQFSAQERFIGDQKIRVWNLEFQLINNGLPAKLIEIKDLENTINWTDNLPIAFETTDNYKYYSVNGSVDNDHDKTFKALLIFEDSLSKKYEYILKGENHYFEIERRLRP